jgi:hypothetical protein
MKLPLPADLLVKLCCAGILLAGIFGLLQHTSLAWYWNTFIAGAAYLAILFLLRLLPDHSRH